MRKIIATVISIILFLTLTVILGKHLLNEHSVAPKSERKQNLIDLYGTDRLTDDRIGHEISLAFQKYTNWDNLFLSENFKKKYKNRKSFLDDVWSIEDVYSGIDRIHGENSIAIYAQRKSSIFDTDESDDITTEYCFRYVLNDEGEVEDLILIEKRDVYTIDGMPVGSDIDAYY